ncbi:MAG: prepilin-type N-terminal cleavage/methylation domain-containing protein [bacterium]|jgi:prepilin-type N-terminal cleavage/methylation domain-containing protein
MKKQWGVTLLELLLAMTILGSMTAVLYSSLSETQEQDQKIQEELNLRQEIRAIQNLMARDFSSVVFLRNFMEKDSSNDTSTRKSGIVGKIQDGYAKPRDLISMHVKRPSLSYRGVSLENDPELHEISYLLEENQKGQLQLIRREEFYLDDNIEEGERSKKLFLSKNIVGFQIRYLPQGVKPQYDSDWLESWDSTQKTEGKWIPQAIKITLEFKGALGISKKEIQEINLRPKISSPVSIEWRF